MLRNIAAAYTKNHITYKKGMEYGIPLMILLRRKRGMYKELLTLTYHNQTAKKQRENLRNNKINMTYHVQEHNMIYARINGSSKKNYIVRVKNLYLT